MISNASIMSQAARTMGSNPSSRFAVLRDAAADLDLDLAIVQYSFLVLHCWSGAVDVITIGSPRLPLNPQRRRRYLAMLPFVCVSRPDGLMKRRENLQNFRPLIVVQQQHVRGCTHR